MKLKVNNQTLEQAEGCTLLQLAESLAFPTKGIAVAVNNRLVPRTEWSGYTLHENDQLVIIKAACGG